MNEVINLDRQYHRIKSDSFTSRVLDSGQFIMSYSVNALETALSDRTGVKKSNMR